MSLLMWFLVIRSQKPPEVTTWEQGLSGIHMSPRRYGKLFEREICLYQDTSFKLAVTWRQTTNVSPYNDRRPELVVTKLDHQNI